MSTATVYNKGGTDKLVLHKVRQAMAQPFEAPGWTDLRVGWFLSITKALNDDDPTGLAEELGTPPRPLLGNDDRVLIGLTDRATGLTFWGFTTRGNGSRPQTVGTSKLVSSDAGIGTTNANFWRPVNEVSNNWTLQVVDNSSLRALSNDGSQIHMVQSPGGAGGYAVCLALRFTRPDKNSNVITMTCKTNVAHSGDILFSNTPTMASLLSNLQTFPATVQQLGPVQISTVPDSFYNYWPFRNSRLRVSAMGFVKAA